MTGLAGDRKLEEMGEEDAREHEGRLRRQEEQMYVSPHKKGPDKSG